jgi:predicted RNA polymerase sigma factor
LKFIGPLTDAYPTNPLFFLIRGDALAKLARNEQAIASYRAAADIRVQDPECAARIHELADAALDALAASPPHVAPH